MSHVPVFNFPNLSHDVNLLIHRFVRKSLINENRSKFIPLMNDLTFATIYIRASVNYYDTRYLESLSLFKADSKQLVRFCNVVSNIMWFITPENKKDNARMMPNRLLIETKNYNDLMTYANQYYLK